MLAREDGGGGTLEAGGGQGHPWFGSWTVQNRVTPGLVTGRCRTGSPPVGRLDGAEQGRPMTAYVLGRCRAGSLQ